MRRRALLLLSAMGCGNDPAVPPKTPLDYVRDGDLDTAIGLCRFDCDEGQRAVVARAALEHVKLDVRVLADDEVLAEYSGRMARRTLSQHMVVRAAIDAPRFESSDVKLVLDGEHGKVPLLARDAEGYASFITGEHYPLPHEWTEWHTALKVPYPKIEGLGTLALAAAEALVVGPFQLLTLHREYHTAPPTDEEIRAAVPIAATLREAKHEGTIFTHTFFARRPLQPDAPLVLHASIALGRRENVVGARLEAPFEKQSAHVDLAHAREVTLAAFEKPMAETCEPPSNRKFEQHDGPCALAPLEDPRFVTIGLTLPDVPKELGTPESSAKAKPYWARDQYAPDAPFHGPPVAKDDDVRLVVCQMSTISVPGEDTDELHANFTAGKHTYRRYPRGWMSFPLIRIGPNGSFSISLWDSDWLSGDDWLATATFKRNGASLVQTISPKVAQTDLACTAHGRSAIEDEMSKRWVATMDELETLDANARIDLGKEHFGLERRAPALGAIDDMASLVGWDDPRVKALVDRVLAHEKRFGVAVKTALEAWSTAHPQQPEFQVTGVRCDKAAKVPQRSGFEHTKCAVDVEFASEPHYGTSRELRIVLGDGRVVDVEPDTSAPQTKYTLLPRDVPAPSENEKPWAVIQPSKNALTIVRVP